ncbi:MAG: hypothetical protein IKU86_02250 [Thermoguttaceae bacterium]|nr:hypothetical protein [Thermoguttaceae bacterium]
MKTSNATRRFSSLEENADSTLALVAVGRKRRATAKRKRRFPFAISAILTSSFNAFASPISRTRLRFSAVFAASL